MSVGKDSRAEVLERIRAALDDGANGSAYANLPRAYRVRGSLATNAPRIALMIERLREYDADVVECTPEDLSKTIAIQITKSGRHAVLAPPDLPQEWLVPACEWRVDHGLTHDEVEKADGVVTAVAWGIAESGTIVLHHSSAEGRRVLSLLPDWHLCVIRASQVVETLPEYFDRCGAAPTLATFISGPSATADIEMTRIKGVHGPRFLNVVIVRDE